MTIYQTIWLTFQFPNGNSYKNDSWPYEIWGIFQYSWHLKICFPKLCMVEKMPGAKVNGDFKEVVAIALPLTYYDFCAMFLSFVRNKWLCFCSFFPLFIIIQLSLVCIIKLLLNLYINISTSQLDPKPLLTNYFLSYLLLSYSLTAY